ncbi:MAG TPA: hypothetical protein VFS86_05105 [Rhodanobacteraceae bacterium]|nr:hypothetical protein [Rhodanobacteraceae bacterium]
MNKLQPNAFEGLPDDAEVEARARALFKVACDNTDSYHALRLGLARRKALDAGAARWPRHTWAPLVGAAACCVLAIGVIWLHPVETVQPATPLSATPVAVGAGDADEAAVNVGNPQMEMVQNLDFYRWLANQPTVASAPAGSGR